MENHPIKNDARRESRSRVLPQKSCLFCGITDLTELVVTEPKQLNQRGLSLLQEHHLFNRATDPNFTITLCRNHHAKLTARNLDYGVSTEAPETILDSFATIARALGVFFIVLGERIIQLADSVFNFMCALDRQCPDWRTMEEAKPNAK